MFISSPEWLLYCANVNRYPIHIMECLTDNEIHLLPGVLLLCHNTGLNIRIVLLSVLNHRLILFNYEKTAETYFSAVLYQIDYSTPIIRRLCSILFEGVYLGISRVYQGI